MVLVLQARNCLVCNRIYNRGNTIMITKKEYIEQQVEGAWEDYKYITQILHDYFTDEVKDMSDKEFKDHLIGLNWEIDE